MRFGIFVRRWLRERDEALKRMKTQNKLDNSLAPAADQKGSACVSRAGFGVAPKQSFP